MAKKVSSYVIRVHAPSPAGSAEPLELELTHAETSWISRALRQMLKFKANRMEVEPFDDKSGGAVRKMSIHLRLEEVTDHMRIAYAKAMLECEGYHVTRREDMPEDKPS